MPNSPDAKLVFHTKVDPSGAKSDLNSLKSTLARGAARSDKITVPVHLDLSSTRAEMDEAAGALEGSLSKAGRALEESLARAGQTLADGIESALGKDGALSGLVDEALGKGPHTVDVEVRPKGPKLAGASFWEKFPTRAELEQGDAAPSWMDEGLVSMMEDARQAFDELHGSIDEAGLAFGRINLDAIPADYVGGVADFQNAIADLEAEAAGLEGEFKNLQTEAGYSDEAFDVFRARLESTKDEAAELYQDLKTLSRPDGWKVYYGLETSEENAEREERARLEREAEKARNLAAVEDPEVGKLFREQQELESARQQLAREGLGPGDAQYDEVVAKAEACKAALEGCATANQKVEDSSDWVPQQTAQMQAANQEIADLQARYSALAARQAELKKSGAGLGYAEYEQNLVEMADISAKLKEYQQSLMGSGASGFFPEGTASGIASGISSALDLATEAAGRLASAVASQVAGAFSNLQSIAGRAVGLIRSGLSAAWSAASGAAQSAASVMQRALSVAVSMARSAASRITSAFKSLGSALAGLPGTVSRLFSSINSGSKKSEISLSKLVTKVLKYGFGIRSLYTLFNKIRSLATTGLQKLAQVSEPTNEAISKIKTSVTGLGNSIAAALSPAIQALEPVITRVVGALSTAFDHIGMFVSALLGKTTYDKVVTKYEDYAESLKKKTEKQTQSNLTKLDEGEVWKDKDDDDTPELEQHTVSQELPDWLKELLELIKNHDWAGIGSWLAEQVNKALRSIYEHLQEWGPKILAAVKAFAEGFNAFVKDLDWDLLGRTAGALINTLAAAINELVDSIDWVNLGKSLATALNGLLDEVDWYELGRALAAKIKILTDLFYGFVTNVNWKKLGRALAQTLNGFISRIDFQRMADTLIALVNGLVDALAEFIETYNWGELAKGFAEGINRVFDAEHGIDWAKLGQTLGRLINHLVDDLILFLQTVEWERVGEAFAEGLQGLIDEVDWYALGVLLGEALDDFLDVIISLIKGLDWESVGSAFGELVNGALSSFDAEKAGELIAEALGAFFSALKGAAKEIDWGSLGRWIADTVRGAIRNTDFSEWGADLALFLNRLLEALQTAAERIPWLSLGFAIGDFIEAFFETADFSAWIETLTSFLNGLMLTLIGVAISIDWDQVGAKIRDAIATFFETADFALWGATLREWVSGILDALLAATEGGIDWGALVDKIGEFIGDPAEWAEMLQKVAGIIKNVFSGAISPIEYFDAEGNPIEQEGAATKIVNGILDALLLAARAVPWGDVAVAAIDGIKAAFSGADFESWGADLGTFFNLMLAELDKTCAAIPWADIGSDIGKAIKGFFTTADFSEWANTLRHWLGGLRTLLSSLAEEIPWADLGAEIAGFVSSFFESPDFSEWGQAFNKWLQGILDALVEGTKAENLHYQEIINSIGAFLAAVDWGEALSKLAAAFKQALTGVLTGIFDGAADSPETAFAVKFAAVFGGLKIAETVAGLFGQGSAIDAAFTFLAGHPVLGAAGAIVGVAAALGAFKDIDVDWDAMKESIGGAMDRISETFSSVVNGEEVKRAAENIGAGIGTLASAAAAIAPGLFQDIADFIDVMALVAGGMIDGAAAIINGLADAFSALANSQMVQDLRDLFQTWKEINAVSVAEEEQSISDFAEAFSGLEGHGRDAFDTVLAAIDRYKQAHSGDTFGAEQIDNLASSLRDARDNGREFDSDVTDVISGGLSRAEVPLQEFIGYLQDSAGWSDTLGTNASNASTGVDSLKDAASNTAEAAGAVAALLTALEESTSLEDYEKLTALIKALDETAGSSEGTEGKLGELVGELDAARGKDGGFSSYMSDICQLLEDGGVDAGTFKNALSMAIQDMGKAVPTDLQAVNTAISGFAPTIEKGGAADTGAAVSDGFAGNVDTDKMSRAAKAGANAAISGADDALDVQDGKSKKAEAQGTAYTSGMASGISGASDDAAQAGEDVATAVGDSTDKAMGISGTKSSVSQAKGETWDKSMQAGIEGGQRDLETASEETAGKVAAAFDETLTEDNAKTYANTFMDALVGAIEGKASAMETAMKTALKPAVDVISSTSSSFAGMFDGVNQPFNDFIQKLNSLLAGVQGIQNEIARLLSFNVTLPADVAALTGYDSFNLNIPQLSSDYRIPYLAQGAVIRPNRPFAAVLGDQASGLNVEAPVSVIEDAVAQGMAGLGARLTQMVGALKDASGSLAELPESLARAAEYARLQADAPRYGQPALSTGTVLPPRAASSAWAAQNEALQEVKELAVRLADAAASREAPQASGDVVIPLYISDREVGRATVSWANLEMIRTGNNPLTAIER